nr:hypothetical protein [Comamonas testosteroni]
MYQEFVLDLPNACPQRLNRFTVRSLLGSVLEKTPIPIEDRMALFHRDSTGQTINLSYGFNPATGASHGAPAPVTISASDRRVNLLAIGPEGARLLQAHLVTIANALSIELQSPWGVRSFSGECAIQAGPAVMYRCPEYLLEKNRRKYGEILRATMGDNKTDRPSLQQLAPYIQKSLVSSLLGQAMMLDDLLGTDIAGGFPTDKRLAINIIAGTVYNARMQGKGAGMALSIKNLVFSMDAKLDGVWLAGQMRSKGMGRIKLLFTHELERYAPSLIPALA